jgi:hypothetical protein
MDGTKITRQSKKIENEPMSRARGKLEHSCALAHKLSIFKGAIEIYAAVAQQQYVNFTSGLNCE